MKWDGWTRAIIMGLLAFSVCDLVTGKGNPAGPLVDQTFDPVCHNFSVGNPEKQEFFSPLYPKNYPNETSCTLTLTAPFGYTVKVEFRDVFVLENSPECEFDYVEARDGAYGYSPLLGRVCGHWFPQAIQSRDRYLWLQFHSDSTLEYAGFRAVYEYVPIKDLERPPPEECWMETSEPQGIIKFQDIPDHILNYTLMYRQPLDCIWRIEAKPHWKISIKFEKFTLFLPNQCADNFVELYEVELEKPFGRFCGTAADNKPTSSNVGHVRVFFHKNALADPKKIELEILYTAYRESDQCDPSTEFDCNDGTCIDESLACNGRPNCNYQYDEDPKLCDVGSAGMTYSQNMIIILIVFTVLVLGMSASIGLSCLRKVRKRKEREREYKERRSKEASLEAGADLRVDQRRNSALERELQATLAKQAAEEADRRRSLRLADSNGAAEGDIRSHSTETGDNGESCSSHSSTRDQKPASKEPIKPNGGMIPPAAATTKVISPRTNKPPPNPKPPGLLLRGPPPYGWTLSSQGSPETANPPPPPRTVAAVDSIRPPNRRHSTPSSSSRPGSQVIADR